MKARIPLMAAVSAVWLAMLTLSYSAGLEQVTISLSGLLFENKLDQSANSLPSQIELAPAYSYSINATVHGTGIFADVFAAGTPLSSVITFIGGDPSQLAGTVPDLSGTLPLTLLTQAYSGSQTFFGITVATTADLTLALDSAGTATATATIDNVNVVVNGKATAADALVVEPGSTITVTAVHPPVSTTGTANAITQTTAVLNGFVNPEGAPSTVTFLWGTSNAYSGSITAQTVAGGLGTVAVSATLPNLSPGDIYHFAVQAANLTGTTTGSDGQFETTPPPPPGSPTVSTGGATAIAYTTALLNASADAEGADTTVYFQSGTDQNYGSTSTSTDIGSAAGEVAVSTTITGLHAGLTYHYRAVASNSNATIYGVDETFQTTPGAAATVFTTGASNVGLSGANISALVDPNGTDTQVTFEYGTSTSYGATLPAQDAGAGSGNVTLTGTIAGLLPGTLYHYRADATNSDGTITGADQVFATTSVGYGSYLGKYVGLAVASPVAFATSGMFTVSINNKGAFSASGMMGGKSLRFAGIFSQAGTAIAEIPKTGVTVHMQLYGSNSTRNIVGTLSGTVNAVFTAGLAQTFATPALYTVRLPHIGNPALPQGNGYGSLSVAKNGAVKLTGKLGDGTAITYSTVLLNNGAFPIYIPLYKNTGSIAGSVVFETTANGVLDSALQWFKPGLSISQEFYGSAYARPKGAAVVSATNGSFVLTPANSASFSQPFDLSAANKLTAVKPNAQAVKATINAATGLFSGSAINPATHKATPFSGAFFQDTNTGTGVYLTPQTGEVDFTPGN